MSLLKLVVVFAASLAAFLVIDLLWLGVVARDFYRQQLEAFFAERVNWTAAFVFYALFIAGVMIFVILPAAQRQSAGFAIGYGVLFGLLTYGTYDLTNLATLRNWPLKLVIVDMCWGMALTGTTAYIGYLVAHRLR